MMSPIAVAALVFALGSAISMAVAGLMKLLFVSIQAMGRRSQAKADATSDMPMLGGETGEGGVTP